MTAIPFSELPKEQQDELRKGLESGNYRIGTGDNIPPWTPDDIARLDKALNSIFAKEN